MLLISGRIEIDPEHRERLVDAAQTMMSHSAAEDGCIEYTITAALGQPQFFHIFEQWVDQAALDAHFASAHMGAFQKAIDGVVREMKIHKFDAQKNDGPLVG